MNFNIDYSKFENKYIKVDELLSHMIHLYKLGDYHVNNLFIEDIYTYITSHLIQEPEGGNNNEISSR
jgi:hypothetical protein